MYKINTGINKLINGIIQNSGWLLVIILTILTLVFSQLGTKHQEEGQSIRGIASSYEAYGKIDRIESHPLSPIVEGNAIVAVDIEVYYSYLIQVEEDRVAALRIEIDELEQQPDYTTNLILQNQVSSKRREVNRVLEERERLLLERDLFVKNISAAAGVQLYVELSENGSMRERSRYTWRGEYRLDKIFDVIVDDVYAWVMAILLMIAGIVIKNQGAKTGKMSGLKLIWKTTLRHSTLSDKISPKSKEAEAICEEMNALELYKIREKKLNYVAMQYDDVFTESGKFKNEISFVKVQVFSHKTLKGKIVYREDKYQKKLLKKQKKVVEKLKKYYPVEVHIHNLLETKHIYREKFDLGVSIEEQERKQRIRNVISSVSTILPMITSVSVFVYSQNTMNLLIGALGTLINVSALLINMFSSYAFIIEKYQDSLVKKCDLLLQIGNRLGLTDEKDRNWSEYIDLEEKKLFERQKQLEVKKRTV